MHFRRARCWRATGSIQIHRLQSADVQAVLSVRKDHSIFQVSIFFGKIAYISKLGPSALPASQPRTFFGYPAPYRHNLIPLLGAAK